MKNKMSIFTKSSDKKSLGVEHIIIKNQKTKTELVHKDGKLTTIKESKKSTITKFKPSDDFTFTRKNRRTRDS